ncbi:Fe-Mn family superoxide dismutase [Paenibacillus glucanolyticus]|uniref:Fe-Mn family superoxide dismutase n=1 Tax=Paenibacillus glucanolyticus TaxID=59843 RepID=UPI00096DBF40|nr:Fe-Mn family superoxide dismutase [Paenibacillus glucanolyticus]OMF81483.1 superoxide dismutase [Paenibacillus glucanolyticus]
MLFHYGAKLPVRLLEEIRYWKHQERKHIGLIKAVVPDLEPVYVQMLDQWALVFADTEKVADELLRHILSNPAPPSPQALAQVEQLLRASCEQSREFIRQLHGLKENSEAVQKVPLAGTVVHHVIRESEYFLNVLETLNSAGALERFMDMPQQSMTLHEASSPPPSLSEAELSIQGMGDNGQAVPIGGHRLPPLPYAYNALEPYIDEKTMRIHHDIHHQSYVDGLNKAEKKLEEARKSGDFELVKHWERELAFNGAGHYLHTIFWDIMNPRGGGEPGGELAQQIKKDFGSFDRFKKQFTEAADKVEGGGWAILVWSPRSHRLEILQAEKHQNLSQWDVVPLLVLDVWEHAYYLKHQNKRKDYINDWWKVVYWPEVAERFKHASKLKWKPF